MGWKEYLEQNCANYKNFVLLGEAGSGKSEIALNLAAHLAQCQPLPVHFFDLDMTKPLFRSRDLAEEMEALGVHFHFEKQFMDADPGGRRQPPAAGSKMLCRYGCRWR